MKTYHWNEKSPAGEAFFVKHARISGPYPFLQHTHDYPELILVENGYPKHLVNGQTVHTSPGSLLFIRPNDYHEFVTPNEGYIRSCVGFPEDILSFLKDRYFCLESRFFWARSEVPFHFRLDEKTFSLVKKLIKRLSNEPRKLLRIDRFLLDLFVEHLLPSSPAPSSTLCPDWLTRALDALQYPSRAAAGTKAFFEAAGRNPKHVARVLKQYKGTTPTEAVNNARLVHAKNDLELTNKSILEITYECGFDSPSYFHNLFQRTFGMTPRQYRFHQRKISG